MKSSVLRSLLVSMLLSTSVFAQPSDGGSRDAEWEGTSPDEAFELNVGSGYSQRFGDIAEANQETHDRAGTGTLIHLGLGYRLHPRWMLGLYGEAAFYRPEHGRIRDHKTFGSGAGAQVHFHLAPFSRIDPWIGLSAGWRSYYIDSEASGTTTLHGLDVVRLQMGLAYQMGPGWSVNPVVGASLTEFLARDGGDDAGFQSVDGARATTFVFAGVINRFDFGRSSLPSDTQVSH